VSFPAFVWASSHLPTAGLPPSERLTLLVLADLSNKAGVTWPSYARLSTRTGLSERRCQQAITRLIELGLVERVWRTGQRGRQTSNMYRLMLSVKPAQSVDMSVDNSSEGRRDFARSEQCRGEEISPHDPLDPSNKDTQGNPEKEMTVDNYKEGASLPPQSNRAPCGAQESRQGGQSAAREALAAWRPILGVDDNE
jgi:hypothetical protein